MIIAQLCEHTKRADLNSGSVDERLDSTWQRVIVFLHFGIFIFWFIVLQFYHPKLVCHRPVIQILRNNFQILYISPIYDWKKMEYNRGRKRGDRNGQLENGVPAWVIRRRSPGSTAHAEGGALVFLPEKRRDRRGMERPCHLAGPFHL